MTTLRTRMDNDMLVRGRAERTREAYLAAITRLARFYHRPPDQLSPAEVQAYVVHMLREEHLAVRLSSRRSLEHLQHRRAGVPVPQPRDPRPPGADLHDPGAEAAEDAPRDPQSRGGPARDREHRHFGLLANRGRTAKLARCRALLAAVPPTAPTGPEPFG